jgi:uncharacterized damage-inducible protein DinB
MDLKKYLSETFRYNDKANRKVLEKTKALFDNGEVIRLLSHLVNCQFKWMARITQDPKAQEMDWWKPLYEIEDIESKWAKSLNLWLDYIESKTESELLTEVTFIGFDGGLFAATPADIALQLNYHSIHHRAQMQTLLRQQGVAPDFLDYIGTKYRKLT